MHVTLRAPFFFPKFKGSAQFPKTLGKSVGCSCLRGLALCRRISIPHGPTNTNGYSASPVNPLRNKTYCAGTCWFKAPINTLVTAYVFLFTAAARGGAGPAQERNGEEQQGWTPLPSSITAERLCQRIIFPFLLYS